MPLLSLITVLQNYHLVRWYLHQVKKCSASKNQSRNFSMRKLPLKGGISLLTRYFARFPCILAGGFASSSNSSLFYESSTLKGCRQACPQWLGLAIGASQVKSPARPLAVLDILLSSLIDSLASITSICCSYSRCSTIFPTSSLVLQPCGLC